MRMTRIEVKQMFGEIDIDITLNVHERLTIIHGPNGSGKSTLFRLLDMVFNPDDFAPEDFNISFDTLTITYINGSQLIVTLFSDSEQPSVQPPQRFMYSFARNINNTVEQFQSVGISETIPLWAKDMITRVVLINTLRHIRSFDKDANGMPLTSRSFNFSAEACLAALNRKIRQRNNQQPISSEGLLLIDLINKRFINKVMIVGDDSQISFVDKNGNLISPGILSSGEQHLFFIFCALLSSDEHSLVLLDEPEISLHVAWQQKFLQDLHAIMALRPIDVVIATHSPLIIRDSWDLTVGLGEHSHA